VIIQLVILFILAGLAIGSFLNVCIDRLPAKQSLMSPPSHCDSCKHRLNLLDLVPVFSYIFLGGKCRYCKSRIPLRSPAVEFLCALFFFLAYWRYGLTWQFPITAFWCCIFLLIIFIDLEHQLILNVITYPAAIIAVILIAIDSFVPGVNLFPGLTFMPANSFYSGLICGALLMAVFFLIAVIRPGSMGLGDVKLVGLIGFVSGFPLVVFSMIIGIVLGGIVAVILLSTRKKKRQDVIPYGSFLGIGPIIALLFAAPISNWYLHLGHLR
jgi:leader peptidase (prepilin peptidase) / N-methyltransferase